MFWYVMHLILFCAFLWCGWVKVQVLSLFETVAYNHKTDLLLHILHCLELCHCIKVVLATLQHLLILTKKKSESLRTPVFFFYLPGLLSCQPGWDHHYEESDDCKRLTVPHASISTS